MKKANQEYQNNKTINNHLSKKLLASSGFLTGAIVSLSPYLAKVITPKTIYVQNFVADNVSPNSGDFSFKLQGKTKQDTDWAKKADLELVYISQKSRYSVKTKVEYDPKTDTFHTYADNLLGGSIYELQLVAPNNPRYYFSFSKTSQFFSTKNQVEKFSHYDIENDTILDLDLFDSQNLLDSANLILYYKEIGSNKILEAKGQLVAKNDQKQASFVLRNLDRNQKYEIVGTKYYFDDPDQLFDLAISPLANRYFAPSPIAGKILNLSQKAYGLNSALLEISLAFENKNIKINPNEKINLEYYYKDELDNFQFGVANDVSLIVQNNKVFANLDLKQIPGGTKFWISRIWNNSGSLAISTNNNLSFISAPEIARIRTFVDANNTSSFDIKFNDQSLMLNGKEVKINFFADDQPTKMLSSSAQVVGNKLFSLAKNLPKEKHFTISSLEIVENATNFDENGQPQTSQIFFAQNFDQKQKKFFTNATSAMVESVVVDRISEDQSRISMILDSVDDFIKDKIATLYFKVAGSSNLIKSQAQAFSINGNKLVLSWDLINLEPGTNYLIDSVGIADSANEFVNKLFLNFGPNISTNKLTWTTRPAVSSITYTTKSDTAVELNIAFKNILESLKKAKITYKELIPGGTSKTIDAIIENNSIIANLPIDSLSKGQNYLIEKIEVEDYKSSKGDSDILAVSKTITPAQKIFGVHAPLVLTKIKNVDEQQTTAKLKVTFSPETIKAIGNDKVKIYYSLAGSSKLLSAFAEQTTGQNNDNSLTFELSDLEIGSKYNINSIVLTKEVELNQDTNKVLTERNILFGDADHKFDSSQSSFFTQSAIIEVGYDNSYEQRVIATFILADAKGVYNGKTATLKYRLKAKNGDENLATNAKFKEGKISAKVNSARILFDITDLYKQGLYEIDKNSLKLEGTTNSQATAPVQAGARVRRSLAQFADTNTTPTLIPFKDKLLDSHEKSQFETIPKTANVTKIQLTNRTKNTATFEVEFGKDFPNQANTQTGNTEKLDDFLNKNKLKVRFKKYGGEQQEQIVEATTNVNSQKTSFELTGLENGQQYVILGFEQVQDGATQPNTPKVDIYLDDLDFYKDQIIATAAVIKKIEFDTEVETQARLRLELKDDGRYTAGKKLIVELEKIDVAAGTQGQTQGNNLTLSGTSLNGIYDFTFLNLEKATKYKIKSVKFEKEATPATNPGVATFASRRSKRSLDPVLVNVDSQSGVQEEEIELLETDQSLEEKKSFVTTAKTAKIVKIETESIQTTSLNVKLTLDNVDDYLGQQKLQLTYRNLSQNTSTSQDVAATVDTTAKTITFQLSNLSPGDKYEIENIKLKEDSTQVRNELDLKKQEFKFEFDNSPNTQAGFEKQFFSPRPSLAQIKPISTSETSVQINVKLNDNGANWNNKFLQIKIKSKGAQVPQPKIPTVYSAEIINGNAVFDISGLEKAGQYEIEELKVLDSLPAQPQPNQIQGGEKVDGFDSTAATTQPGTQPVQPDQQVTKEFVLDAESATITDISYKSDNTSADIRVSFAQNEQFLYQSSANTKRKLQFTFQDAQSGQQVTTQKEFESNNQGQGTKPTIDLSLDSVSPGNLYVLTKVEDITPEVDGGPKRLKTFKFSDPQQAQGAQNQATTTTPEVLSKLYFATKPEVIAYSIDKISETKYLANFTIRDPLAGRAITNGGFEGRDVEIKLQKMFEPDGTDLQNQTVYNVTQKAKIKNSKFTFELDNLEKNAIYKVLSLTWADTKQTQQQISGSSATLIQVDPTTKTATGSQQNFSDFAIKVSDPGTNSQIEGNVAGNGQIQFGDEFTIRPESAKVVKIEIDDKKVDSATITLTFDNSDQYLKHINYQDKLELIYYQTGSTVEKTAKLTLDNATGNEVKFKAELTDLEKGTGFRVLGIKQASSGGSTRRRRSTTSSPNLNFVFDTSLTEDTKKFATLPIVNSILQFRNDANPENYDFILNLKDTGDVFKQLQAGQSKSIKAKIQFKKVADGNEAKDTIEEVQAELTRANQITSGVNDAKKSDDQPIQDSTTFKFTLSGLDPFAQYYITKIAYDTTGDTDTALNTKTENNGDKNSGLFNFSPQAEEKRAFLTYPAKVDVKSIDIEPDFNQNNAKLTIKFDPKFKAFLETHQKIKVNYKSPKGLGQSVEIDKNNFNTKLNITDPEPSIEVTINNINEPGKYVVESLDFLNENLKSSPLLSNLEVPPIAIKESVTIAKRSFYTNTKIIAIRKKAISETSATIELVIEDPNGSFIGKVVKGTFTYNTDRTREEKGTIIADEIEKTSKVVFQLKNLDKNTDYSITSLVFDQAQNQTQANLGGDQTQFQAQQNIEFDDQKIQENAQQDSGQQTTAADKKQFKTTFESATALGITYQLDKGQRAKPWQKAKVRVFFSSQDKPLEEKSTRLKLVYKSSKQGISNTTTASVQAKLVPTQGNSSQGWLNNQPDRAHYYYEFDLDNLDAGAQYTIIGLEDEAQQIKIIVPDPNAPVAVNFSSQPSVQSSFSFNTAPLITKMTYVPSETGIKLNLAVENSQKLDFTNHRAIIKFKKLNRKNREYGWWDPSQASAQSKNKELDSVTVRVPQRQPSPAVQAQQDSEENFGITFLEFELGGLDKGSWYLIEEISLSARGQGTTPLSLYIDKEKLQPEDKKLATSESEKWQTIVNTTVETTAIRSVTSSTTRNSNITVSGQRKSTPELTSGYFQIELDRGDLIFLQDKYNIQLELESVERKIFYTESKQIEAPSGGSGRAGQQNAQLVLEAKGLIPGDKYKIKNYIFNLKEGAQDKFGVRLPQELKVTPPANNSTIDLKTKNAIKAIKYEAVSEGRTNVDVEFYNNNGELNNQNLTLSAEIDQEFGNKYIPSSWKQNDKTVSSSKRLTPTAGQITSTLQFQINSNLKKAKQYIIKSIKKGREDITFDTPISQESALQRKFYSIAEKTKLINTTISEVTTDSATIKLEFGKDDAFLKDDLVTLYLEKGDQSQSIGTTTTITNSSSGGDKLEATFRFLNILEPGRKYKINALTSKTVDLKVDEAQKVTNPNLTQGWKFAPAGGSLGSSSSGATNSSTGSGNQVILDFITQPLITNIVKTQINDNDATIELEGWTKDIQDAGFNPKFTVTEKNPTQPQPQPPQQPSGSGGTSSNTKEGQKQQDSTPPAENKITFKVDGLEQFTEYNDITLKLERGTAGAGGAGGGSTSTQNQLSQDLTVAFAPEIASGAKKDLREFRTTAKKLNLADTGAVTLKPISTTTVNLSVKLKNRKQADSIADVPFSVLYKKVFPIYQGENIGINDISSNPVLINPDTQTLTFNISNLEPGAIYEVTQIAPTDFNNKKDQHQIQGLSYTGNQLLKYLKDVGGLPVKNGSSGGKQNKIYFAPLNVPVSLEAAWSHPLRYDYYEGEQIYVRFNQEAGTAITEKWLKDNLKVKLIPNTTHSGNQGQNQRAVEKELTNSGSYTPKPVRQFNGDLTLSDLQWDPLKTTATFKLQPKSLKSIVGAQIQITMKDINNYQVDPSQDSNTNNNSSQQTQSQSITFRLQSSAVIVTPTNVDYMNPGLMGFSYAIYDPLDLIQKTGKDYNPFGEFPHLTPYDEQDWLKVVINKRPNNLNFNRRPETPDANVFNNRAWNQVRLQELDIPEPPVAIRTKTDVGHGIKYLTLYWRINTSLGTFGLPEKFRNAKPLWYPAGGVVHLPISLQFKTDSITSLSSTYSFVLNSPYGTSGHVMPYARVATPHDAKSIVNQGTNYWNRWNQHWGQRWDSDNLIPRINKFPKNISKVFWSAPSFEWTTNDSVLNDVFFLNRALPRLIDGNTRNLSIQTGIGSAGGTRYDGSDWDILYVKNKDGSNNWPELSKTSFIWDWWNQNTRAADFENQNHKSSWIISITNRQTGHLLLYDPLNYYAMLGPFKPPELPE
ncbi:hypothetical protein Q4497_03015 [Mesomycoplasma ovipneumoniae]|uniref:DUF1410 domain-containing protein n=1 Tax=Mesomycoplasma ovipneumoniae TaxID=29562 RepID=A0AAW6Q608_9BACT|nr:hypothetical protein [Mesomycoplasma ovipneumoniae]MDF9627881.1 hypothetical protein [Mesomycoplasma ovipneumoniae]MDO4157593.1 hypothetical protein [Mesomycoplasma ovipneumoniae]MDO6821979.1 hypothetical protein [Mesomycoplasma ovipneumoniae]